MSKEEYIDRILSELNRGFQQEMNFNHLYECIFVDRDEIPARKLKPILDMFPNQLSRGWTFFESLKASPPTETGHFVLEQMIEKLSTKAKEFNYREPRWHNIITYYPGIRPILFKRLLELGIPFEMLMYDDFQAEITDNMLLKVLPGDMDVIIKICERLVGNEYLIKRFGRLLKNWKNTLKRYRSNGVDIETILKKLPDPCLVHLKDIGPVGVIARMNFYAKVLSSKRPMPPEATVAAVLALAEIYECKKRPKNMTYSYHLSNPLLYPEWLIGRHLLYFLEFADVHLRRDMVTPNLPSEDEFKARIIDLLLSRDAEDKPLYNNGIERFRRLNNIRGMEGETAAEKARRVLLKVGANGEKYPGENMAIRGLITMARDMNDEEFWRELPDIVVFIANQSGKFTKETPARELLSLLERKSLI